MALPMQLGRRVQGMEQVIALAEAGSFVAAAERLGQTPSALGKAVSALEERLGVRLFHRTTRRVALTEEGATYLDHCCRVAAEVADAEASIDRAAGRVAGLIRVGAPVAYGQLRVVPHLASFARAHPGVRFDLRFTDRVVDPLEERLDLVVRIGELRPSGMRAWPFDRVRLGAFAAPGYLSRMGAPERPDDLGTHARLGFVTNDGRPLAFAFARDGERVEMEPCGAFLCTDAESVMQAAIEGLGVCYLPTFLVKPAVRSGALVPVLAEWTVDRLPVHLLAPAPSRVPRRVQALVKHMLDAEKP